MKKTTDKTKTKKQDKPKRQGQDHGRDDDQHQQAGRIQIT